MQSNGKNLWVEISRKNFRKPPMEISENQKHWRFRFQNGPKTTEIYSLICSTGPWLFNSTEQIASPPFLLNVFSGRVRYGPPQITDYWICYNSPKSYTTRLAACRGLYHPIPSSPITLGVTWDMYDYWYGLTLPRKQLWRICGHFSDVNRRSRTSKKYYKMYHFSR